MALLFLFSSSSFIRFPVELKPVWSKNSFKFACNCYIISYILFIQHGKLSLIFPFFFKFKFEGYSIDSIFRRDLPARERQL